MKKLSNKKLLAEYRKVFFEYESEQNFDNCCARTLTRLLVLEKILNERCYMISIHQENTLSFSKV